MVFDVCFCIWGSNISWSNEVKNSRKGAKLTSVCPQYATCSEPEAQAKTVIFILPNEMSIVHKSVQTIPHSHRVSKSHYDNKPTGM